MAEEVFFRGYLLQALGSLVAQPWFGVVVSAVVFALLHGTQNLPLFVDRLAFGLLAGVLVWRTGGLEAGIAAHVVNNVFAYVIAGLTTSIAALKAISGDRLARRRLRRRRVRAVRACWPTCLFPLLKLRTPGRSAGRAAAAPSSPVAPVRARTRLQ